MASEDFHEIQLNGKQMFFLFMAGTVVFVVIFLIGVQVGRNVEMARLGTSAAGQEALIDPTAPSSDAVPPPPSSSASSDSGTPVAAQETLTYSSRLEDSSPPVETLNEPIAESPVPAPPVPAPPVPAATPVAAPPPEEPALREPPGNGYVVQVTAVKTRPEADAIARRLSSKGYPSFVTVPTAGTPAFFRVRIGKYGSRREAETIANRLEREEQFKPWITR